jgi:hypothetical protein
MSITTLSQFNFKFQLKRGSQSDSSVAELSLLKSIMEIISNTGSGSGSGSGSSGSSGASIIKSASGYHIEFYATSVTYLSAVSLPLDYNVVINILNCLRRQQDILYNKYNYGIYYIDLNDIIVIDSDIFIYTNPDGIKPLNSSGNFIFNSPFYRNSSSAFFSPELMKLDKIPATINYKCFYYSLGAFGIYCLFMKKLNTIEDTIEKILKPIYQTKLYWMILRSCSIDHERRSILFI